MQHLIPTTVKRNYIRELRRRGLSGSNFYVRLFATALYFLLKNYTDRVQRVVIDIEYPGKNNQIREHLINLLRRARRPIRPDKIQFKRIGKKSDAHRLALQTFREDVKPNLVLTESGLLGEF